MKGSLIHLFMGMIRAEMAGSTGFRIFGFFQRELVRSMATVTPFLDHVATFAESSPDLLRNAQVLPLGSHSVKPDGVTALLELLELSGVTFPAFFRKDHGLLFTGCLVIGMTSYAMDPLLGVFRFDPGLEEPRRSLLVARDAKTHINLLGLFFGNARTRD